jgi:polyisoprenoid-binding protein YceI
MVKLLISLFIFPILLTASALLQPADDGSSVRFAIKNFGGNVTGSFKGLKGKIVFDGVKTELSTFDVTIDVKTINTGIKLRDTDLKKEKYFNVEKFPLIRMVSTGIMKDEGNRDGYVFKGVVIIKGVKKEISFPFTATQENDGYLFKGSFPLNRRDFGVGGSSISLSDNLTVTLSVLVKKA